jgi:hypothetical protein
LADIFQEVDEEVRREQLKKLWDRYGNYLIALAILLVLGIAGWRGYQWWEAKRAAEAGAKFEAAIQLADEGKHKEAQAAFARLTDDSTAGYRKLARLRDAAELARTDPKAAVAAYDAIAADSGMGRHLQQLATLRAAVLLVDSAPFEDMRNRLEPLTGPKSTFRHSAREMLALSAWRAGDAQAAKRWADLIMTDGETPASVRARIEMLVALGGTAGKG